MKANSNNTSMAKEFPIKSVQSKRCWFLTTGNILAAKLTKQDDDELFNVVWELRSRRGERVIVIGCSRDQHGCDLEDDQT